MHGPWLARGLPPSTITGEQRARVLALLNSEPYRDLAIPQVWARELDEGRYWCSESSMYRIARDAGQSRERRTQASHPPRVRPELVAYGPSEVWSWDITALKGPQKGQWYKLYVVLDIFSRYVPGWLVAHAEDTGTLGSNNPPTIGPSPSPSPPTITNPGNETSAEGNTVSLPISATDPNASTMWST